MFQHGIYNISYRSLIETQTAPESATAMLRDGKILGSDHNGGVFSGTVKFDPARKLSKVATLNIAGHFKDPDPTSKAIIDVAGGKVEIELSYLGPLPS
jgi:hypothetical protein